MPECLWITLPWGMLLFTRSLDEAGAGPEPSYQFVNSGFQLYEHETPFQCELTDNPNGGLLPSFKLAYETWGELNADKSNAVLLFTGLSASSHAKSHEGNETAGWWEKFIGPGKALDTNSNFVVCANVLGGCYGSSGPSSTNPATGAPYAMSFPLVTCADIVRSQFLLLDHLGIDSLHAVVGSSMGGMLSLAAAAMYPDRVAKAVSISAACRSHPTAIALRYMQRRILMADPHWNGEQESLLPRVCRMHVLLPGSVDWFPPHTVSPGPFDSWKERSVATITFSTATITATITGDRHLHWCMRVPCYSLCVLC